MKTTNQKKYMSTILIRNGEYETLTHYCFTAPDYESAEAEVTEAFDIGGSDHEEMAELSYLVEVTAAEYKVLSQYI
jgi:hypothetical protein|tara:strand:- start:465 stop:692 length:228 start_codon:yes stop_codon:yes gene_type:complete